MRTLADTELLRARWRRSRQPLAMLDPLAGGFVQGGLANRAAPTLRVVVLPTDPESNVVRFDDEFSEWWKKPNPSPPGTRFSWGHNATLTAVGTFRGEHDVTDSPWERLIGIRRHGGVDLGADVTVPHADKVFVPLLRSVALIWAVFRLQRMLQERLALEGPWEVTIGLRDIGGAILVQYAEGWEQPLQGSTTAASAATLRCCWP